MMDMCRDCNFSLLEFTYRYRGQFEDLLGIATRHGLLLQERPCDRCGNPARLDQRKRMWRCSKTVALRKQKARPCGWTESIFKNTFFEKARLDIETILLFLQFYLREEFSFRFVKAELGLSDSSIIDWTSFSREVLIHWSITNNQEKIGGRGRIVEMDESKFGRRKYMGRVVEGQWVFGGICRETRSCFMVPVEDRTADTLLEVIKERIEPGTTIISNCWRTYNCLSNEGYRHLTVNHSVNFVDPADPSTHREAVHPSNTIEKQCRLAKRRVPLFGRRKAHFVGYLARSMFIMKFKDPRVRFHQFLLAAASLYDPRRQQ